MESVRLAGLWKKEAKDGSNYLTGKLSDVSTLMILPNKYKKSESDPDYFLSVIPRAQKKAPTPTPDREIFRL